MPRTVALFAAEHKAKSVGRYHTNNAVRLWYLAHCSFFTTKNLAAWVKQAKCGSAQTLLQHKTILASYICQENNMNANRKLIAVVLATGALLTGCASNSSQPFGGGYNNASSSASAGYGVIDSIQVVQGENRTSGAGAILGGVVGALAGNQVGSGGGRTAATVAGGVAGAAIGNSVEKNRNAPGAEQYQINVRMDNGEYRAVNQDSVYDLRVGNRVRIVDGRVYRY
jgi:outer membrane lipoprotein SlyB